MIEFWYVVPIHEVDLGGNRIFIPTTYCNRAAAYNYRYEQLKHGVV